MKLMATRAHSVTCCTLNEGAVLNIDRDWVLAGRDVTDDDLYITRGIHAQLFVRGRALFVYNRHPNRIRLLPWSQVCRGDTVRVDGHVLRFGFTHVGDVLLELDTDDDDSNRRVPTPPSSPPSPTPPLPLPPPPPPA